MRKIITILVLIAATSAHADNFGGNVQLLQGENGLTTVSPEYYWSAGRFSGFGFHDVYDQGGIDYLAAHSVDYNLSSKFYLAGELGMASFGNDQKYGFGVRLADLPVMENIFTYFNVTYYAHVEGANSEQVKVVWGTKSLELTDTVGLYFAGFTRQRTSLPDVWQPQVWLTFEGSDLEIGLEVDIYDGNSNPQLAVKWNF